MLVGHAQVRERSADAAVLDQEGAVAGDGGGERLLRAHDVGVPEARHVDAALDRRAQLPLVGRAAAGQHEVRRARSLGRAAGSERVAGRLGPRQRRAAGVMGDAVRDAVLDQRQRGLRHALGVDRAWQRGGEARRVGEVDRGRGHARAEPPGERTAVLDVREPVEGDRSELEQQRADARAPRAPPGSSPGSSAAGSPANAALAAACCASAPASSASADTPQPARVAAAARAGIDADHLQEGVGDAVGRHLVAARDRGLDLACRPDPVGLERCRSRGRRRRLPARLRPGAGSSAAVAGSWPSCVRPGRGVGKPG